MRRIETQVNIRRALALFIVAILLAGSFPAAMAVETSGRCGDDLNWELAGDTLVITGTGEMWNFPESTMAPWYSLRDSITRLSLPDGLTSIGNLAFYQCNQLNTVIIPDTVHRIGDYAFAQCAAITMLDLGKAVNTIGKAAFRECSALGAVRLPDSLTSLGFQAFYRCESLSQITVPSSVTDMGMTVFGYCYGLVRAEVYAMIQRLPDWTFYGCESLTDVYLPIFLTGCDEYAFYGCESLSNVEYEGDSSYAYQINQDIQRDLLASSDSGTVGQNQNDTTSTHTKFDEVDGELISVTTVTQQTPNAELVSKEVVTYPDGSADNSFATTNVEVTLENADGWNEISDVIAEATLEEYPIHVDVFLKEGTALPEDAFADLAEQKVTVTINTANGSSWQVDCSQIHAGEANTSVDLNYQCQPATLEQSDALNGAESYQIRFDNTVETEAEIIIRLPKNTAQSNAFLYQMNGDKPELLQSSRVDSNGNAHFYLANVDRETEYLLGINVPNENTDNVIIPKSEEKKYDITDTMAPIDYVITGRKSSWNMNIGQVTWIMAGVLIGSVAVIGVVIFMLNKRKLKKGYVVDLDDYETSDM